MSAWRLIPMFHRRVALLLGAAVAASAVLSAQLVRLTVVEGESLRAQAERRLESREWLPTVRGRILDRNGRVLVQDRPSFDVAVDYGVIAASRVPAGRSSPVSNWSIARGGEAARRLHPEEWPQLGPEARQGLVDHYAVQFEAHVARMWRELARVAAQDEADIAQRRASIVEAVERGYGRLLDRKRMTELRLALANGRELTEEIDRIEASARRRAQTREQISPHVVVPRVPDSVAFTLMQYERTTTDLVLRRPDGSTSAVTAPAMPGMHVWNAGDREYPYDSVEVEIDTSTFPAPIRRAGRRAVRVEGVATTILGWMKPEAQAEDVQGRESRLASDRVLAARAQAGAGVDRGTYLPGDPAGATGVESSQEIALRGLRGMRIEQLDTGEQSVLEPIPGRDVRLTIDVMLQARVQALMDPALGLAIVQPWHGEENPDLPAGTPLNGGAVVLDVESGDILAMVSTPTFSRAALRDNPDRVFGDTLNQPAIDRAVGRPYPPGSIVKPLIASYAATHGQLGPGERIECTGQLYPGRDYLQCWVFKRYTTTHTAQLGHDLTAAEAIMVSCNIFFYKLGQRLGPRGISAAYRAFGVEEPWTLGLGFEHPGKVGHLSEEMRGESLSTGDAINMGIGQGPIAWTPLHAASAYATLARGGVWLAPRLVHENATRARRDLKLDPAAVRDVLDGLHRSVNEDRGTGHHVTIDGRRDPLFALPGFEVWGKTGTAQAPIHIGDPDGQGPLPERRLSGDHSWFVVLVGRDGQKPRYAIAVMMEYAGSGGRVSGPIVSQIIRALIDEGYL